MPISYCNTNHILVGLGGTGGKILKAFKMRMFEEYPKAADRNKQSVALLYVDSTREMMGIGRADFRVMGLDASFTEDEFLYIKDVDVTNILDNIDNYPSVKGIVDNVSAVRTAIGQIGQAAGQKRRAGRLLFAANSVGFVQALQRAYAKCESISHDAEHTNIHIFTGLCGGTGSGAIIDAIIQARKAFPNATINVYAMIPELNLPKPGIDQGRYYPNGYAALNELNALQAGRFFPHDVTGASREAKLFSDRVKGVCDGLTLYSNVNENGLTVNSFSELPKIVSDYIYARVFLIDSTDDVNEDMIRAYAFENMDDFALEKDETKDADVNGQIPIARTKKINSFGIKRVMYPELRVLKHITYTVGESVLYQFKYNNWRENLGYTDQEPNKDYRNEYFNEANLSRWMIDDSHLTYEMKVLPSDREYPSFYDYWNDKAVNWSEEAKKNDNPLNKLQSIMLDFFEKGFRGVGVKDFYKSKERAIPEISKEIRRTIEHELFAKWKTGDISIVELQKVSKLLLEWISEKRKDLDEKIVKEQEYFENVQEDCRANVDDWVEKGFLKKKVFGGNTASFAKHQGILTDYFVSMTMLEAWDFAKKLGAKLFIDFGKLDADISAFGQKVNDALEETERLIAAQKKVNKGLEDMKGATIEVSEEETMAQFETDLRTDRVDMPNIARQLREEILPKYDFTTFGNLATNISVDDITLAFEDKLAKIVKTKHDEKADSEKKVLGLNILTQLQQQLLTDEDIKRFAFEIVRQSGVYLKLNNDQMQLHVRNNEGNLSPSNPASINKKTILVSIPSPDENEGLSVFADKLERAFQESIPNGPSRPSVKINKKSPRKDELSIITVSYCFPMRCMTWLPTFKDKYEQFLNTGNKNTDASNTILLYGEGDGKTLPSLFVVTNANTETKNNESKNEPQVQVYVAVGGKPEGPYTYTKLKEMVASGELTEKSMVWQQGMAAWVAAGQMDELKNLFVPAIPPIPNTPDGMPSIPMMPPMPEE